MWPLCNTLAERTGRSVGRGLDFGDFVIWKAVGLCLVVFVGSYWYIRAGTRQPTKNWLISFHPERLVARRSNQG